MIYLRQRAQTESRLKRCANKSPIVQLRFSDPRMLCARIATLGRLMARCGQPSGERNGEEGNDTAFYYWLSTTSVN